MLFIHLRCFCIVLSGGNSVDLLSAGLHYSNLFCVIVTTALLAVCVTAHPTPLSAAIPSARVNALRLSHVDKRWAETAWRKEYGTPPFTVEAWAKVDNAHNFNALISYEPKYSRTHWELFTHAGNGYLSAYMPGYANPHIISERNITDGEWCCIFMSFDGKELKLGVDGELVLRRDLTPVHKPAAARGPLMIGKTEQPGYALYGSGRLASLRMSKGIRSIENPPPEVFEADEKTLGLWNLSPFPEQKSFSNAVPGGAGMTAKETEPISLDELDRRSFGAGPSPFAGETRNIELRTTAARHPTPTGAISLDGEWSMAEGGDVAARVNSEWLVAIPAAVPGSIHTALLRAGRIPDPVVGKTNMYTAKEQSFKTWWLKREFQMPDTTGKWVLKFAGIANRCSVWLNGRKVGDHEGMFGGPDFDVTGFLRSGKNILLVKLDPFIRWQDTVVFNCTTGWHYSDIPPIGIWRSVRLVQEAAVVMGPPFVSTHDPALGEVDLVVTMKGPENGWKSSLDCTIQPENFDGEVYGFTQAVVSEKGDHTVRLRFRIPDPRLWWPNDMGEQNLYRMKLSCLGDGEEAACWADTTFGLRTVSMAPLPGGRQPDKYDWTFVINGKPMFVKGTGWCTADSLMDFSRERYDRLLKLARDQHIQMLRAWGGGMPETDDFYDLCDRYGIMVYQEWPTAWDSHFTQPYDILEDTVRRNTVRLRNHPSLAIWGGGNESYNPFGPAIDMMGRLSIELDGTRAFHRSDAFGGSCHAYYSYWDWQPVDSHMRSVADFWGEFGLASFPDYESVQRYLPDAEKNLWPPPSGGSYEHHTPIFNTREGMARIRKYTQTFLSSNSTMRVYSIASQLAQSIGVRHTLERARTRWPHCTGALYYKMNDNYPAASWSSVDWHGAPKISHYFFQDSFAPLKVAVLLDQANPLSKDIVAPIFLLDDNQVLAGKTWSAGVRVFDEALKPMATQIVYANGAEKSPHHLGSLMLSAKQTAHGPLFVVAEVMEGEELLDRTFYWLNYEVKPGSLFDLPETRLSWKRRGNRVTVRNRGPLPAIGVEISAPGHQHTLRVSDNHFWLDVGESQTVTVNRRGGLRVGAWNALLQE